MTSTRSAAVLAADAVGAVVRPAWLGSGDYKVTVTAGGRTMTQLLRVEQLTGGADAGFGFGTDDDDDTSDLEAWFERWVRSRK